jgi:hypothetical protein
MNTSINRREFLSASLAAGLTVGWGAGSAARAQAPAATGSNAKLYKALIMDKPTEEGLKKLKDAGFDGVEAGVLPVAEAEECRRSADKVGMKIHAVLRGWAEFNSTDREKYDRSMAQTEAALRAAQAFGADAVLLGSLSSSLTRKAGTWTGSRSATTRLMATISRRTTMPLTPPGKRFGN